MPRVSVVIPAYNAAALLGGTLESTLNSIYQDMEIIVVNDGSQDETAGVASSFGHRVRVITQKNAGMSASRNRGIEESDSEFIALLDSDDIWHKVASSRPEESSRTCLLFHRIQKLAR